MADSGTGLAAPPVGGPFELIDHHHHAVSDRSFLGRKVLMLFGFTHCRVVCPRSLQRLSVALGVLQPAADDVVALYVTVDPERDDAAAMRAFLQGYPRFLGLTGSRAQIDCMKAAYRIYARRRADVEDDGNYVIAHTTLAYVLDEHGAYATHVPLSLGDTELVDRLRAAFAEGASARQGGVEISLGGSALHADEKRSAGHVSRTG